MKHFSTVQPCACAGIPLHDLPAARATRQGDGLRGAAGPIDAARVACADTQSEMTDRRTGAVL